MSSSEVLTCAFWLLGVPSLVTAILAYARYRWATNLAMHLTDPRSLSIRGRSVHIIPMVYATHVAFDLNNEKKIVVVYGPDELKLLVQGLSYLWAGDSDADFQTSNGYLRASWFHWTGPLRNEKHFNALTFDIHDA